MIKNRGHLNIQLCSFQRAMRNLANEREIRLLSQPGSGLALAYAQHDTNLERA